MRSPGLLRQSTLFLFLEMLLQFIQRLWIQNYTHTHMSSILVLRYYFGVSLEQIIVCHS
jgi:hypothetical protein